MAIIITVTEKKTNIPVSLAVWRIISLHDLSDYNSGEGTRIIYDGERGSSTQLEVKESRDHLVSACNK